MMKLFDILFEEYNTYAPPNFCLIELRQGILVLIHVSTFLKEITKNPRTKSFDYIAGYINLKPPNPKSCSQVYEVGMIVGNPTFRGAGYTMYCLASDYYKIPLTSDRTSSTSKAAKDIWKKIEGSSEWVEAIKLDNYGITNNIFGKPKKTYVKFNNGKYNLSSMPNTPEPEDDCLLPSFDGGLNNIDKMLDVLGTPNAYKYSGQLKAEPMINYTNEVFNSINKIFDKEQLKTKISIASAQLWQQRYKGPNTQR